jgi:signal transduction histidine kinase
LTNILRHSGAGSARVGLELDAEGLAVRVTDDGTGFWAGGTPRGGGLQGLADRLQAIGGSFTVSSIEGRGTELLALIPTRVTAWRE